MDKNILEFWGNIFLAASRNQRLFEELTSGIGRDRKSPSALWDTTEWLQAWSKGLDAWSAVLEKAYPRDVPRQKSSRPERSAAEIDDQLSRNWREWLELMNLVPRDDYLQLQQELAELEKQLAAKEARIEQLETLLTQKGIFELEKNTQEFQALIQEQSEQFQKFMHTLGRFWKKEE